MEQGKESGKGIGTKVSHEKPRMKGVGARALRVYFLSVCPSMDLSKIYGLGITCEVLYIP